MLTPEEIEALLRKLLNELIEEKKRKGEL